jgi:hypothetical protein
VLFGRHTKWKIYRKFSLKISGEDRHHLGDVISGSRKEEDFPNDLSVYQLFKKYPKHGVLYLV